MAVGSRVVRLSGEHDTLPRAELESLLAVHAPQVVMGRLSPHLVRIDGDLAGIDAACARAALVHGWLDPLATTNDGDVAALAEQIHSDGQGSIAVRAKRLGGDGTSTSTLEATLGKRLVQQGHKVDLETPERTLGACAEGSTLVAGWRVGTTTRGRYQARHVTDREHFSPVALHPRRAASLLHLARVPPGGRVLDPFCGTGTFVLEAAEESYDAWGSDLDPWMVQGTLQALADAGETPLDGVVFPSDIGAVADLVEGVHGIVTDLPYGRASNVGATDLQVLYHAAFAAFAHILQPSGRAVIGMANAALAEGLGPAGFEIEAIHAEYVHRSLTRHYVVARRV